VASTDELQALVDKLKETQRKAPEWERQARAIVWAARIRMFGAVAFAAFNAWALSDVLLYAVLQSLATCGLLIPATRQLIQAENSLIDVWKLADESATDLKKYTAMLEYQQAQAITDERPQP
jgi:hypothetical protein